MNRGKELPALLLLSVLALFSALFLPAYAEDDRESCGMAVSAEVLRQLNSTDAGIYIEFNGTADIELAEESYSIGQTVTLRAAVTGADLNCRLVWEANDGDERGWYIIASGPEYTFTVTSEILNREYRAVLLAVN